MKLSEKKNYLLFIAAPFFLFFFIIYINAEVTIRWPVDLPGSLSATLGETRGYSLHQGIDIKTNGRTGYPVYAVNPGRLSRLISKDNGYGNAVFLDHSGNRQSVYGHLDSFEGHRSYLTTLAETLKIIYNNQNIDFKFFRKKLRYKKNEKIGYTGETGSGLPHLHFELRKNGIYLNPLDFVNIKDTQMPVIEKLFICTEKENTTVSEKSISLYKKKGVYRPAGNPRGTENSGRVFFKLSCYDQVGAYNKVAVYSIRLYENDRKIFERTFDRLQEHETGKGHLIYDISKSKIEDGVSYAYFLCNRDGNNSPGKGKNNNGYIDLKNSSNSYKIEVSDHAGNNSILLFNLDVVKSSHDPAKNFQLINKGRRYELQNKSKNVNIKISPESLGNDVLINPDASVSTSIFKKVRALSKVRNKDILQATAVKPFDHLYKNRIKIVMKKPYGIPEKDAGKIMIYKYFEGNKLKPLNTSYFPLKGVYEAGTRTNGYYFLLRDKVPPVIQLPPTHEFYYDEKYYRKLRFSVYENVSRIDKLSIECIIDGESFPSIYDRDRKWVEVSLLKETISSGLHHILLKVNDRAGNSGYFRDLLIF